MSQAERTYIMVKVRWLAQPIVPTAEHLGEVGGGGDGLEIDD
jgi:hypothetical protein